MKGNKKILVVAILLLLIAVSYGTYAIYKSSASATGSVTAARWVVSVNDTDIVANNTFTLDNIEWASPEIGQAGTIAPGDRGTITIDIDADGSQVAVGYKVEIGDVSPENAQFTVEAHSGNQLEGVIPYSATEGEMERSIVLDIVWEGIDTASANADDIALSGHDIEIPVVVTATQNPNPAATNESP